MSRSAILLANLLLAVHLTLSADIKTEESVLVLTQSNFDEALQKYDNLLVEFYAPWCGHCQALAPEYAKAAKKLEEMNSDIKLAKVDATVETKLAEQVKAKGYPTIKFYRKGEHIDYSGGRQSDDIVNWLVKKTGPPAKNLATVEEVKAFVDESPVAVVGFFSRPEMRSELNFLQVAAAIEGQTFGISRDPAVLAEYKVEQDKIVVFKKFDDKEAVYTGEVEPNILKKFITIESLPLIVDFNHETAQKVFGGDVKSHLLLFLSKKEGHYEKYLDAVKPIAKEYRDKLIFVTINADEPDHLRILEFFGLQEGEVPTLRIIKLEDEMSKYKPESTEITAENIKKFIPDFLEGKLKEHLLSQPLPEDWDKNPVKVLVASNFDSVVFDTEKDVLVEFYAPWCGHCKHLAPIYEKLAEHFEDRDDIVITKIDVTANELEHTKIGNFPTIKLYKRGDNKVIEFVGERTVEDMTKFVESGGESGQEVPPDFDGKILEEPEEEDEPAQKDEL